MGFKLWFIFLVLSVAYVVHSLAELDSYVNPVGEVSDGDWIAEDEMAMDSEVNDRLLAATHRYISYEALKRNTLLAATRRYISYGELKRNTVPCSHRGQSYYNCNQMKNANPYKRSCSVIPHCKRFTG